MALGAEWKFGASLSANATLSDNIFLAPPGQEQTDLVLGITPAFNANYDAARLKVKFNYIPTLYLYAVNKESDYVANSLNAFATLEAAEKFFFIDALAQVTQTYVNPFASQPQNGANITSNRTSATTLGLSPYIQHTTASGLSYLMRSDNSYTIYDYGGLPSVFTSNFLARIDGPTGTRLRWGADYNYNYTQFEGQETPFRLQLARLRLTHTVDADLSVTADGGYESNNYGVTQYRGPIYGVGFDWKPTPRTDLFGNFEHRFFGPSYLAGFSHRTRMTAFNLGASRNIQASPQQLYIPAGNTQVVLDQIFQARIPDPAQRQQAVNDFIQQTGLPPNLAAPFTFYTNQIYVVESFTGSFAIIGVRNTLTFSAGWYDSTPVTASGQGLPPALTQISEVKNWTAGVAFNHQFSATTNMTLSATHIAILGNTTTPSAVPSISSTQDTYLLSFTRQFTPKTSGMVGVRYVRFNSDTSPDYQEHAILAGVAHTF